MMDEEQNTRLVRQAYERFKTGDVESFINSLDSHIEWQLPAMENVPFAGAWHGREGVKQFLRKLTESQEVVEFRPEQFVAQGNKVIVLGHFVMRVKSTGRESASDWAHVWTITAGKVTHYREYVDTAAVTSAHNPSSSRSRHATGMS